MNVFIPDPLGLNIGLLNLTPTIKSAIMQAVESIPQVQIVDMDFDSLEVPKQETSISPDIVIMGESEPRDSMRKQIRLARSYFRTSHILLVVHAHENGPFGEFLESGVRGILCTDAIQQDLPIAINAVKEGRLYIDVCQSSHPVNLGKISASGDESQELSPDDGLLSSREKRVLFFVAKGFTNQQIADELGVSIKSIENDKSRIKERLGLETRADIVKFALEQGFLNMDE